MPMSMPNPYSSDDDPDADIFERPDSDSTNQLHHALDGSVCPRCGVVHEVSNPDLDIPDAVLDDIAKMMDDLPDEAMKHAKIVVGSVSSGPGDRSGIQVRSHLLRSFSEFTNDLHKSNIHGPMIRALAEVLDSISEGEVTQRWQVYALENSLIMDHMALKSLNMLNETIAEDADGTPPGVAQVMSTLVTKIRTSIATTAERYRILGREFSVEIDEQIISAGVYSRTLSPLAVAAMPASMSVDVEDAWRDYVAQRKKKGE